MWQVISIKKPLKLVDKYCKPAEPFAVDRVFEKEPRSVVKGKVTQALSVATPLFQFGFKEEADKNRKTVKELAAVELLLEILASEASPLFRELQQSNLINESSFSYEFFEGPGYASIIFAGESKNPDQVAECIKKVNRLRKEGIPRKILKEQRKQSTDEM
ncbi:MAG: insulinase family protein [Acutalibacteraceae bacterium]